jgi:GT2 family glycosyltransferase
MHPVGISILIPTWNGRHLLEQFLPSVIEAARYYHEITHAPTEIIVVDDGSTDRTVEWLGATDPEVILLKKEKNEGFGPACNLGIAQAKYPIIFLLNNDVAVERDVLTHLVKYFSDPGVFAVCCKDINPKTGAVATAGKCGEFRRGFWRIHANYDVISQTPDPRPQTQDSKMEDGEWRMENGNALRKSLPSIFHPPSSILQYYSLFASGGFSAFDAGKLRQLGGFNPLLVPFYWEDVELGLRAWRRGWKILYEPRAIVRHSTSSTIKTRFVRRQIAYVTQRNRLITHWVNLHDRVWLIQHLSWVLVLLLWSGLTLRWTFWRSFFSALRELLAILDQRRKERRAMKLSDRQIAQVIAAIGQRSDTYIFERVFIPPPEKLPPESPGTPGQV